MVLKEQKYVDFGLSLVNGCYSTYASELTGIGPEGFAWVEADTPVNDTINHQPPPDQEAFYRKAGFWNSDGSYILRPEVIESFYYAFRATGDQIYRDWAWEAFLAINSTTRTGSGFAELRDGKHSLVSPLSDITWGCCLLHQKGSSLLLKTVSMRRATTQVEMLTPGFSFSE